LGPIGSAVLKFIGYKQTDKTNKYLGQIGYISNSQNIFRLSKIDK